MGDPPFGIYLVDKPAGPTSHDVVMQIRRRIGRSVKVGHAGTLDPFATGLLVVAIGRATRLLQYLTGHDKTYRARVRLGATSATGDPEGPIVPTPGPLPSAAAVAEAVVALTAQREQRVPAYSAVRVDGERLYARARRGDVVETPTRPIVIHSAELLATDPDGNWFDLEVTCSKGTYIRQVAVDLGTALHTGAYCEQLRRTAVGALDVREAVDPEQVPQQGATDPLAALAPMPTCALSDAQLADITHGRAVTVRADHTVALTHNGLLVAIGEPDGDQVRPRIVIA